LNIVIFGWVNYSYASPAASRLRTLAKGWIDEGAKVHLLTTAKLKSDNDTENGDCEFTIDGFSVESSYVSSIDSIASSRIILRMKSLLRGWQILKKLISQGKCDVLYLYALSAIELYPASKIARNYGVPYFFDICEWAPRSSYNLWFINPWFYDNLFGMYLPGKHCSGVVAITKYIAAKFCESPFPVVVVPAINDFKNKDLITDRIYRIRDSAFIVVYSGFCKPGDGVQHLLDAVRIVKRHGVPVKLIMLGADGVVGYSLPFREMCERDMELRDLVQFKGVVPISEYYSILCLADVLVLPRQYSQTNLAAFPTRLPEYLMTGRPVLISDVPDVSVYLKSDIHAKIVQSDSSEAIASGLIELWGDQERACHIGMAGRERGAEVFDYRTYTKMIYKLFIDSIKKTS